MKRAISIFLVLVILSTIFAIFAAGFDSGGFTYTTSGTTATITAWASSSGSVEIPATVTDNSTTYRVTEIGDYAFANKPGITSVTLGDNLTIIGEGAFSSNNSCYDLTIPASVTNIGPRAFHSWVALSRLTFADDSNITTIDKWAFRNAQSLSKITLPDKENGTITIEQGAFSYCSSLATLNLPKCVSTIGEEAFLGCVNLASVNIRDKNASIGSDAFDLTASTVNATAGTTTRSISINGYENSTAQSFANSENLTFHFLPPEPDTDAIQYPPAAGSYYVKVTGTLKGSTYTVPFIGTKINSSNLNNEFTAGWDDTTNDSAGVVIRYRTNNGNGDETYQTVDLHDNITTSEATKTGSATIPGFPNAFYFCLDQNDAPTNTTTLKITKIEIGSSSSNLTTLWSGTITLNCSNSTKKAYIYSDGTSSNNDSQYVSISTSKWNNKNPVAKTIEPLTDGVDDASVNTDGTNYRSPAAFTYGEVKDQYGVVMNQNPTLSVVNGTGSDATEVEGASVESDYRRLVLEPKANKADDYDVYIRQTAGNYYNTRKVRIHTFDYQAIFSYTEGTKRKTVTQTIEYGYMPTDPGVTPIKYSLDGHQTFNSWAADEYDRVYKDGPQLVTIEAQYNTIAAHNYGIPVQKEAATCTEAQIIKETCSICQYDKLSTGSPALGHTGDTVVHSTEPVDGQGGVAYFQCTRCNTCWGAVNDNGTFTKDTSNEQEAVDGEPNIASVAENTSSENILTPAPAFNRFFAEDINYDYSRRGAALKICSPYNYSDMNTRQHLRFTASMLIPKGVSYQCGNSGNCITDFGYVYSQTSLINNNIDNLYYGAPNVYKMSVASNNSEKGNYDGSNWVGVSTHDDSTYSDGKALTFNLVVKVKAYNWAKDYCARAYITYNYNGQSYTVYDSDFSSRSVVSIAQQVVNNDDETERVRNYCQNKILNYYQAAIDEKAASNT